MKAPIGGSGDFELTPMGNHISRIYMIVDIGMQTTDYGDKRQIIIGYELCNELMEDGRPFVTSKWYTLSLNAKASLCKDIESMFGKSMSDSAKESFDFEKLLNAACMINIVHEEKDGKTKAKAKGLTPLPKGTNAPALQNPVVFFDLDAPDEQVYQELPEWIQKRVNRTSEASAPAPAPAGTDDFDDYIPF